MEEVKALRSVEEKNDMTRRKKRPPRLATIYGLVLLAATLGLALHVLYSLWWVPAQQTGTPQWGHRIDDLPALDEEWLRSTEQFGATLGHVDYVDIFTSGGPVMYFNVRLMEGTALSDARAEAQQIVAHFVELAGVAADAYNLQVVVSYGDIETLMNDNQTAVERHVWEYNFNLALRRLEHAEQYPSQTNVDIANSGGINFFRNSIVNLTGLRAFEAKSEDEKAAMSDAEIAAFKQAEGEAQFNALMARLDAIPVMSAEQLETWEEQHGPMPVLDEIRQVEPSNISDFPNWGVWNGENGNIRWNN